MNLSSITPKKNKAQAMVEFALVLPILLMLLYGILEAGRLLFIYSTVVTASRQAVRYGSATGEGTTANVPRYQDCAGIRDAAQKVDFLDAFEDEDILIQWDNGPGTAATPFCTDLSLDSDPGFAPTTNSTRLNVTIDGDYLPIVPRIVGFLERSNNNTPPNPIVAQSARTVLVGVSIFVTVPPSTFVASTSTATNTPIQTPTNTSTNTPTNTATFTPIVSNTPSITPSPTRTPTATLSPTVTSTPTRTFTPTLTPTRVPSCVTSPGSITLTGDNTMTLTISNPNAWPIRIQDLFVVWDHDRGHQQGNDKSLILQSASLGGTTFWTGSNDGPSTTLTPTSALTIPPGSSVTLVFTFHQEYNRSDGSEEININLSTPGCETFPIHVKR